MKLEIYDLMMSNSNERVSCFEVQVIKFFISYKSYVPFLRNSVFLISQRPIKLEIYDVMMSNSNERVSCFGIHFEL